MGVVEEECNNRPVSAKPESAHIMPATPEFAHVMLAMPESAHVMPATKISPKEYFWGGYSTKAPADAKLGPGLIASVMDPPLMSVRAAGIPRASALAVTETVPLTSVLPVMAVAILCMWAAHCTPEASRTSGCGGVHCRTTRGGGVHCRTTRGGGFSCRTSQCGGAHS